MFLYVCDMVQKTFVESLFWIPLKTFLIDRSVRESVLVRSVLTRSAKLGLIIMHLSWKTNICLLFLSISYIPILPLLSKSVLKA